MDQLKIYKVEIGTDRIAIVTKFIIAENAQVAASYFKDILKLEYIGTLHNPSRHILLEKNENGKR